MKNIKPLRITIVILILLFNNSQLLSQGLSFADASSLEDAQFLDLESMGFSQTELPSKYSMEAYAPPVLSQQGGTCVGWATTYAALSIMYNRQYNITDEFIKWATAFDPYYVYTVRKSAIGDDSCEDGMRIIDAIEFLSTAGSKKWAIAPYLTCADRWEKEEFVNYAEIYSYPYRTSNTDYGVVKYSSRDGYIENTKEGISLGIPIVIGVNLTESFKARGDNDDSGISNDGLWLPKSGEESIGGHAMTVIGYDDYKFGGSFQVMNSWGEDFGDDGYVWITYDDFVDQTVYRHEGKYYAEAYYFFLDYDRLNFEGNPLELFAEYTTRVELSSDKTYDGRIDTYKWIDYKSLYNLKGQLTFKDGSVYSGGFRNGKYHGYGLYFDYEEKSMYTMEYNNGNFIDSERLGFSEEATQNSDQLRNYLDLFSPEIRINTTSNQPMNNPLGIKTSKKNK